ncbi:methyltransferase [Bosea vestrisii]|uniref:Methyltransferase n=1 Tax=Bosea vestrisii TaxID=151416 RepID=A0ABW0H7A3_9HYPH
MTKPISPAALQAIASASFSGGEMRLAGKLDPKTYAAVDAVVAAAGGKWSRKARVHLFPGDARTAVDAAIESGAATRKQDLGQFDSTPVVVARIVELAQISPGASVLEPSAGLGAIAHAAAAAGAVVTCVELDPSRAEVLKAEGFKVLAGDFLTFSHIGPFDLVLMNPPFAGQADIDHVRHAAAMLRPGGLLVAVMSAGVGFRQDRKATEFRAWLQDLGGSIESLPEGAFKASGTSVRSVIVTVRTEARA